MKHDFEAFKSEVPPYLLNASNHLLFLFEIFLPSLWDIVGKIFIQSAKLVESTIEQSVWIGTKVTGEGINSKCWKTSSETSSYDYDEAFKIMSIASCAPIMIASR